MIRVAVDAPLLEPLSYEVNTQIAPTPRGSIVQVPLGKRSVMGIVLGEDLSLKKNDIDYKKINSIEEEWPALKDPFLKCIEWLADYYIYPIGQVAKLALPPLSRQVKIRKTKRAPVVPQIAI